MSRKVGPIYVWPRPIGTSMLFDFGVVVWRVSDWQTQPGQRHGMTLDVRLGRRRWCFGRYDGS